MSRLFAFFILLSCLAVAASAQISNIGINPLLLERGARPLSMGGAFVAMSNDVYAQIYNPAGLLKAKGLAVSAFGPNGIGVAQAYPIPVGGTFGVGVFTSQYSALPISGGTANANGNIVSLSYGSKLLDRGFSFGLTGRGVIRQSLETSTGFDQVGQGWDLDAGFLWQGADWWTLGVSGLNLLPKSAAFGGVLDWDVGEDEGFPSLFRVGAVIKRPGQPVLYAGEIDLSSGKSSRLRLGVELPLNQVTWLRFGYTGSNVTYGLGFKMQDFTLDVGMSHEPVKEQSICVFSATYAPLVLSGQKDSRPIIIERMIEELSIKNNLVTIEENLVITGKVKPGLSVLLDGQPLSLANDGSFYSVVPLKTGDNFVSLEMRYQEEKKTFGYKIVRKTGN